MGPVAPELVPGDEPEEGAQAQRCEEGRGGAGLEFEDGEAGGVEEGVVEGCAGGGVGEMVEGEGEEVEGFAGS